MDAAPRLAARNMDDAAARRAIRAWLEEQRRAAAIRAGISFDAEMPACALSLPEPDTHMQQHLHGVRTWLGACVLAEYVRSSCAERLRGRCVLELGAGTGAVGLTAALVGGPDTRVVLTDRYAELVSALRASIERNGLGARCRAAAYEWGAPLAPLLGGDGTHAPRRFDVVLVSECTYTRESTHALCGALALLFTGHVEPLVLLGYEERASTAQCAEVLSERGYKLRELHVFSPPPPPAGGPAALAPRPRVRVFEVVASRGDVARLPPERHPPSNEVRLRAECTGLSASEP